MGKANFVLSTDYDTAVTQLRGLSEAQIEEWQKNPNMALMQYRAMVDVLGEKQSQRHSELTSPDKVARRLAWLGIAIAAVALLNDFGVFSSREKPATPPPSQSQLHSPTPYPVEPTPVYLPSKAMGSALPATTQPTASAPPVRSEPKTSIPSPHQE